MVVWKLSAWAHVGTWLIMSIIGLNSRAAFGVPQVTNGSFEADTFTVFPGYYGNNGGITGWTCLASGIGLNPAGGNPFADNGAVPNGTNVAFIACGGSLMQRITGFEAGVQYRLTYFENSRAATARPKLQVSLGNMILVPLHEVTYVDQIGSYTKMYHKKVVDFCVAAAGTYALTFYSSDDTQDNAVLIDNVGLTVVPDPHVTNGSFEADNFTVYPGNVNSNGLITGWTSSTSAGLNPVSGAYPFYDNGNLPDGNRVAFLPTGATMSQTINNLRAGLTYRLIYYENARVSTGFNPQLEVRLGSQVLIANHVIVPVDPVGSFNEGFYGQLVQFTVPATGSYSLTFTSANTGQDCAALIDNVQIMEATDGLVYNGGFEADNFTIYPGYVGNNGPITGWSSPANAGLNPVGGYSFWDNGSRPEGSSLAFVQNSGTLSQPVGEFQAGVQYRLTYYENARAAVSGRPQVTVTLGTQVLIANHQIEPVEPVGYFNQPFHKQVAEFTVPVSGVYTLSFVVQYNGQDSAVLFDKITLNEVLKEDLTRGHYLLVKKGLQVQAMTFPEVNGQVLFSMNTFAQSNFSGPNTWTSPLQSAWVGTPPGPQWGRVCQEATSLQSSELPYLENMVTFQYMDEFDPRLPNDPNWADYTLKQNMKAWFALNKVRYPNVISHFDQCGGAYFKEDVSSYTIWSQPDMVNFNNYPFTGDLVGGSPTNFYKLLMDYRWIGLVKGLDGNGAQPIPYGLYLQTWPNSPAHTVSESEMRLNQFAPWAFGFKFANAFVYTKCTAGSDNWDSILFTGYGDGAPTGKFTEIATTNAMSRKLGPALVRLISTDVRMVMGKHHVPRTWFEKYILGLADWAYNSAPVGVTTGISGADTYMANVSGQNPGSLNWSLPGDVIIGYFKPLHESFDGPNYSNQKYFMITNGLSDSVGNAAQTTQNITVDFNFGSSGINSLQRMRRSDGVVETISVGGSYSGLTWTNTGTGTYRLVLTIDGGTGDLFKYNTGAPFVGTSGQL